jgi:hypothetical protein
MKEYSYFLAQGMSLEAFETMRESKAEFQSLKTKLCAKFGAHDIMGGYREDEGHFRILFFHFRADQKIPEGWKVNNEQKDSSGALQCTFAMPASNTPDHFHMASMCGLMERASRQMGMESIFGSEWFMRDDAVGTSETAFVRQRFLSDPGLKGKIPQSNVNYGGYGSGRVCDPLSAMELDGKMYIRVPNKPGTDEPICIPQDAQRVSYDDMLKADQAEWDKRHPPRNYNDMSWGC